MEDESSNLPYMKCPFWAYVDIILSYRFLSYRLAAGEEEGQEKKKM